MSEVTEWQYVCIRVHFITKMSLLATQSDWSVCAGWGRGGQWCVFCCFSRELRPAVRLIFPLMNGVKGNCRFHKSARMTVWVSAAERFIVIKVRRPLTIAFRRVPRESCVFYNRVAWWNEVERQCEQRWGPFEGHIKLDFMSSSAACVDGDKEGLSGTDSRSVSKVRRWHLFVELWMRYLLLIIDLSLYSGWRATNISLLRLLVSVKHLETILTVIDTS